MDSATQTKGNTMHSTENKTGNWMTAKEMAMTSHNLKDGAMTAVKSTGHIWRWAEHFDLWYCTGETN